MAQYEVASSSPLCRTVYGIHYNQILSIKIGGGFGVKIVKSGRGHSSGGRFLANRFG